MDNPLTLYSQLRAVHGGIRRYRGLADAQDFREVSGSQRLGERCSVILVGHVIGAFVLVPLRVCGRRLSPARAAGSGRLVKTIPSIIPVPRSTGATGVGDDGHKNRC